jgi:hypothetical protein
VTDLGGGPFGLDSPGIVASNGLIQDAMLEVLGLDGAERGGR